MVEGEMPLHERSILASGAWLTAERATGYPILFLGMQVAFAIFLALTGQGALDLFGNPKGTDFASFWTASRFILEGDPAAVYDPMRHHAAETRLFGADVGYFAWFYPPMALLLIAPLGLLSYGLSLLLWLGATLAGYVVAVRKFVSGAGTLVPMLGFPAVFINIGHGQNGLLSTAIVGAGLALADRRPFASGVLLGCLCYKPQLAPMLAVVVLARRDWRMALGAAASVAVLAAAATLWFGADIWSAFFSNLPLAQASVEDGLVGFEKMQSPFSATRLLGGGVGAAYGVQAAFTGTAAILLWRVWRTNAPLGLRAGATASAILLGTPFLLDYDLVLLALPIASLAAEGLRTRFLPYEKSMLAAAWVLPFVARQVSIYVHISLAPAIVSFLLVLIFTRVTRQWKDDVSRIPLIP